MEGDELHKITSFYEDLTTTNTPQNVADSPFSGDEGVETAVPPPKKRKGAHKRVVTVPFGGGDGSPRTRGEVYPPPDTWSWRKYGQKPIKGSPYPRSYYRCSSSKGCPARKQVERDRLKPTMLLITYTHNHNHTQTATNKHHHRNPLTTTTTTTSSTTNSTSSTTTTDTTYSAPAKAQPEELAIFANHQNVDPDVNSFPDLPGDFGWFSDMGSTPTMVESTSFVVPKFGEADVAVMLPIGEEDQSLYGDLEELPECSMVFRHFGGGKTPCYGGTG